MSTERFPTDLLVTIEDFRNSGWSEAVENAGTRGYSSYWESFSKAARGVIKAQTERITSLEQRIDAIQSAGTQGPNPALNQSRRTKTGSADYLKH